jgi:hypothetical protein
VGFAHTAIRTLHPTLTCKPSDSYPALSELLTSSLNSSIPARTFACKLYRWKSSLVMKGEVVTHQLDCAVAGSAASALTSPAFVAALSVFCSSCAMAALGFPDHKIFGEGETRCAGARNGCAAIQPDNASTSLTRLASAASKALSLTPATGSMKSSMM